MPKILTLLCLLCPLLASAHGPAVWELTAAQLAQLDADITEHRTELLKALAQAAEGGLPDSERTYRHGENSEIPRSVLNRVLFHTVELESAAGQRYFHCGNQCEHSLQKDLNGNPQKTQLLAAWRWLWPKIDSALRPLYYDLPVGTWKRIAHARTYGRSLQAQALFRSRAYGTVSMALGALTTGTLLTGLEVAESFFAVAHLACQANYLFSVAVGTAVASLSRDAQAMLLLDQHSAPLPQRLSRGVLAWGGSMARNRLEKTAQVEKLAAQNFFAPLTETVTYRQAQTGALQPYAAEVSARGILATDTLLWAELYESLQTDNTSSAAAAPRSVLWDQELENLGPEDWLDMNASLRSFLKILKKGAEVKHVAGDSRSSSLKAFGLLDRELFHLDYMIRASTRMEAAWLRPLLQEWMAIAVEASQGTTDFTRLQRLSARVNRGLRGERKLLQCPSVF